MEKIDIILIGATGYTGAFTAKQLVRFNTILQNKITWGICGRSKEKLKNLVTELEELGQCNKSYYFKS